MAVDDETYTTTPLVYIILYIILIVILMTVVIVNITRYLLK
jgi:hypothetical protein